ncbi:MAG: hypothetical protein EHM37_17310 [Deltaproteobacteria bacterium]|nr:MAG: hypothetical protein EHM37_17310 [Deltaproteobacteria bacterium]
MSTKAEDVYAEHHQEAMRLVEEIKTWLENMPAPDDKINWGHVGDLGNLMHSLRDIVNEDYL